PIFLDNPSDNINFNPVVKFTNNGSVNQFMYNSSNGFYSQEIFIVMIPDSNVDVAASPGIAVFSGKDDISPNGWTGIGIGDYTSRISGERLWFNQWNTTTTDKYYALGSNTTSFNTQKVGLINAHNTTTTPANGMTFRYDGINVGNLIPADNSTFYNIGNLVDGKIYGAPYWIGKNTTSSNGSFNGRIAEILTYAKKLKNIGEDGSLIDERPRVESYLAIKYGITLGVNGSSQNYVNSQGTIVWNVTTNNGFNYNIAGIARDVNSDLYQKQSKSVNEVNEVTIGLGTIALTNSANTNEHDQDLDYLVWGSNNGTFTVDGTNTMTLKTGLTTSSTRINRKWKIVENGSDVGTVIVSIPESALTTSLSKQTSEEYTLIVSDNSAFGDSSIIDVVPLKSDGNGNLTTWYDFDGTKYFTFGKAPKSSEANLVNIAAGDYLVGEYGLNLNSGSFTVACWIRNDGSSPTNRTFIGKGPDLILRLNSSHKVEALWDGITRLTSNTLINDGRWHHIGAVYTGGSAFLYIDGILDKAVYSLPNPNPNYHRFSVGASYLSKSNIIDPFKGEIDEIHIWDQILSSNQINYLMNQEIEKFADATVNGKIIPQTIIKNEIRIIPWTKLKAYYDFNSFYGTTVEGLTDDRNFLRIKYLNKDKTIVETQTAPLPYETVAEGGWSNEAVWKNGSVQKLPNDNSIITGTPQLTVDGNIVKINHNITSLGNKTLLGLYVDGVNSSDYKTLSA
ncbi:MAG: LamG domain-containing protein, partial [Flavobacteriaceae bacterium]|nr:LamG domain-containing protein [Flavobacteriaceae bacterium]